MLYVRLINLTNSHPERINKQDKKIAANLNYSDIAFPLELMITTKLKIDFKCFGYENKIHSLYISKKSYNQMLNLLLITEKDKSHYVLIKYFNRLMFSRTKHKDRKHYCMSCLKSFTTEEILSNHKK